MYIRKWEMKGAGHILVVQILLFLGSLLAQNCRRGKGIGREREETNGSHGKWNSGLIPMIGIQVWEWK